MVKGVVNTSWYLLLLLNLDVKILRQSGIVYLKDTE